jgi:hypothetical protein
VASNYAYEGRPAGDAEGEHSRLPIRTAGASRPAHTEARAELRDRETYYAELRLAVHCQSRSIPAPRAALDDQEPDTRERRPDDGSWDDMTGRFGDTWT